jgi:hypothetical protein
MSDDLYERYFGTPEEIAEEERQVDDHQHGSVALFSDWLSHPVTEAFRSRLQRDLDAAEVMPGTSDEIVYAAGFRRGLLSVKRRIEEAEQIRSELNDEA